MAVQNITNFPYVANYKAGKHALALHTEKAPDKFTTLKATLTKNYLQDMGVPFQEMMGIYGRFIKEPMGTDAAVGEGFKYIYTLGGYETQVFTPPKAKDKLMLEVPYNRTEISETYKEIIRLRTMTRTPDILAGSEVFISVPELLDYHDKKKGVCMEGNAEIMYQFMTSVFATNKLGFQYNSGGVSSLLASKDEETTDEGKKLKIIKDASAKMRAEEEKVTNIWKWSCKEWINQIMVEDAKKNKYNNPATTPTKDQAKKLFLTNKEITAPQTADAIIRMISTLSDRMTRRTYFNLPYWTGNSSPEFTFTAEKPKLFISCPKEQQVIFMGWELFDFLNGWAQTNLSFTSELGTYDSPISKRLGVTIIPVESLPPQVVKITCNERYNWHLVYSKEYTDFMGQQMFEGQSTHTAWCYGIRNFVPYAELHIFDANFDPVVSDQYVPIAPKALA